MQIEVRNVFGEKVEVDATWPVAGKDEAWTTKDFTGQCKTCPYFIPASNCKEIRHALESSPQAPEEFNFGDNYLGLCMFRASIVTISKRGARNTPSVLFPSRRKNNQICQALARSKQS